MKRSIAAIALFVASIFITAGVWAQSVEATIPFDFIVNDTTVPAGTYTISSASQDHNVLRIASNQIASNQKDIDLLISALPDRGSAGKASVLVFHKYGNQYFLSQIRNETASMYLRVPVWGAEKRARMQTQVSALPPSNDVIVGTN